MYELNATQFLTSFFMNFIVDEVCYPPYGCFSSKPPFDNVLYPLPRSPDDVNTTFWLYTTSQDRYNLDPFLQNFENIKTKKLVVVGHGFLEDIDAWWTQSMVESLLKLDDVSVIVVNWRDGARLNYNQAVGNSRLVGRQVGYLVEGILNQTNIHPSNVHFIGFSLGAHMMGYAGDWLKINNKKIARITGLDPAGVYFEGTDEKVRLDPGDADFVDVIHSDSKTIYIKGLGASEPLGHVDFYPNGGFHQPGCKKVTFDMLSKEEMYKFLGCSHYRAVSYFIESIQNRNAFLSFKCKGYKTFKTGLCKTCRAGRCNKMGYHAEQKKKGNFYLMTNHQAPFTGYHYVIKVITGSKDFSDSYASLKFNIEGKHGQSGNEDIESTFLTTDASNTFIVHTKKKLGELQKIKITHNAAWFNDAWFLTKIIVHPKWNAKRYIGCAYSWFNEDTKEIILKEHTKNTKDECNNNNKRKTIN